MAPTDFDALTMPITAAVAGESLVGHMQLCSQELVDAAHGICLYLKATRGNVDVKIPLVNSPKGGLACGLCEASAITVR